MFFLKRTTKNPTTNSSEQQQNSHLMACATALNGANLQGQVAIVTGGGRGIGRVFAVALAKAGASVAITARSADQLVETVAEIEAVGGQAIALSFDVTNQGAVEQAIEIVERRFGPIDLLVNNAGEWGPVAPMWEVDPERWWRTMDINLRGCFLCAHAVLPQMVARRQGRIINIASNAGVHRWPTASAYAISKAALVKFTENLAVEAKRHGVAVFAIHPGLVTIGLTEAALNTDASSDTYVGRAAAWVKDEIAAGRGVPPEPSARLLVALATGAYDVLTGRYLTVYDDLDALTARAREIRRNDLYTLQVSKLPEHVQNEDEQTQPTRQQALRQLLGMLINPKRHRLQAEPT